MGFTELRNNLIDIIREEQAKLGFREERIRLYYPLSSLNHLLEAHDDADAMNARLAAMPAEITDTLGDVVVTHKGDRFCFNIPEKGSVYVHENTPDNDFIKALVDLLAGHGTTLDDVLALFMSYSPDISANRSITGNLMFCTGSRKILVTLISIVSRMRDVISYITDSCRRIITILISDKITEAQHLQLPPFNIFLTSVNALLNFNR